MIAKSMSPAASAAREQDVRIADVKRAAADYSLARDPAGRREAIVASLRALWEISASAGAPIEGLSVVNKLIQAIEEFNRGETPELFALEQTAPREKKSIATSSPDVALAAALVDALSQYEQMPIQEAIVYVASKRGLNAGELKTARQRLRAKATKDAGQAHYKTALDTIAAQADPIRAIRIHLAK
jgi:hypothetical protein